MSATQTYMTVEAEIKNGQIVTKDKLPEEGKALVVIFPGSQFQAAEYPTRRRVQLPLIHGDGQRLINPTPEELDASLWD